jgi:CheY-like chemotaxis protein
MSILVVDDCEITAKIIEYNLLRSKYNTLVANSTSEALRHLSKVADIKLVVMDILMPDIDGLELFRKMKETPEWEHIPVIMCTALADADTVKRAVRMGCKYYHVKPINPKLLLNEIADVLAKEIPVLYSEEQVMSQFGLDRRSYEDIIKRFYDYLTEMIGRVEGQVAGSLTVLGEADLRKLQESATIMGARRLIELLDRIRAVPEGGGETETLAAEHKALLREMKVVKKNIPLV